MPILSTKISLVKVIGIKSFLIIPKNAPIGFIRALLEPPIITMPPPLIRKYYL